MTEIPPEFLTRMQAQLGSEYADFRAHYEQPPSVGLRINSLKVSPEQFKTLFPFPLTPIAWTPSGFLIPPAERPGKHPYHAAGLYYLQDPAAMAVAELLAPRPGELVLDLSAAPGGKTTHLAALMGGQGVLIANDIHPGRVHDLAKNLERWGARNLAVLNESPPRLAEQFGAIFDRVLVDAPCSGEGMFRKDPAARQEWQPKLVESCAIRQNGILADAARLVRPGGVLGYSTCTFAPEEDEGTLARFLAAWPDFELIAAPYFPGFSPGRPDWLPDGVPELARAVRLWPHRAPGEGHFIALLQRRADGSPARVPNMQAPPIPADLRAYFNEFVAETLAPGFDPGQLALMGAHLYALPPGMPDLRGLRVVHWGWWLGTSKKKRFEPAHALALGLRCAEALRTVELETAHLALRYLHGEVLPCPGLDGWTLVCLDGFPLGWGKRVQGRLKSHSPKWLRWI